MGNRKSSVIHLGETQLEVLEHVWDLGEATVNDVRDRILEEREVAYTTIMTVMKTLAEKGYLTYRKEGVTYVYRPARSPEEVRSSLLENLLDRVFGGSPAALVQTLGEQHELTEEGREHLRQLVESLKEKGEADDE